MRSTLVVASILLTLIGLELGCRLWRSHYLLWHWPNLVTQEHENLSRFIWGRFVRDPLLGWAPKPDFRSPDLNYNEQGTRIMPALAADVTGSSVLLTTGDSYAEGGEVADDESWPAYLQPLVRHRTVNAGVGGYGLDQMVLRAEQQAATLYPAAIVLSFIADDLWRTEMRRLWGSEKPYFTAADDGTLVLRNVPVPAIPTPDDRLSFWHRILGWSALAEMVLHRLDWHDEWTSDNRRVLPAGTGERLACPLMRRLATLGIPTLVVAQYDPIADHDEQRRKSGLVLGCAALSGLAVLDTFDIVRSAVRERGIGALYLEEHHNAAGNRLVATAIAAELERRGMLQLVGDGSRQSPGFPK